MAADNQGFRSPDPKPDSVQTNVFSSSIIVRFSFYGDRDLFEQSCESGVIIDFVHDGGNEHGGTSRDSSVDR